MRIYGDLRSGNCYKVRLVCAMLGFDYEWVPIDILSRETRTEHFRGINPNEKIPALELPDGRCLWESNAIINYLARDSELLPKDAYDLAKVQQWQFFEQYSHEPNIAVARFIAVYLGRPQDKEAEYQSKQTGGHRALSVMNEELQRRKYFVGEAMTTADISLYAYTHVAEEGGFDLSSYPAVTAWLERVSRQPGHVSMLY
tara:strand:+ start:483 stop:1082 length:600 start_codon:yes stop_codon:yes gene_type:complete